MRTALEAVEGVVSVEVNYKQKQAHIKTTNTATEEALLKAVKEAGYQGSFAPKKDKQGTQK